MLRNVELKDAAIDPAKLDKAQKAARENSSIAFLDEKAKLKQVKNDHLNEVAGFRPGEAMSSAEVMDTSS